MVSERPRDLAKDDGCSEIAYARNDGDGANASVGLTDADEVSVAAQSVEGRVELCVANVAQKRAEEVERLRVHQQSFEVFVPITRERARAFAILKVANEFANGVSFDGYDLLRRWQEVEDLAREGRSARFGRVEGAELGL